MRVSFNLDDCLFHLKGTILAVCLCLLGFVESHAQENSGIPGNSDKWDDPYLLREWTMVEGAPSNRINDLIQCENGFLWLATYEGLIRFDGHQYKLFNHQNSRALVGGLLKISNGPNGSIWMLNTSGEILRLSDGKFTVFGREDALPTDSGNILRQHPDGFMVLSSPNSLLFIDEEDKVQPLTRYGETIDAPRDFNFTADGTLWVAPHEGGLLRFGQAGKETIYPSKFGATGDRISGIAISSNGSIWLGLEGGVGHFNPITREFDFYPQPDFNRQDRDLQFSHNSVSTGMLAGNFLGNLYLLKPDGLRSIPLYIEGAQTETVNAITELKEGGFAVATYNRGLILLTPSNFPFFNRQNGLEGTLVNAILEMESGKWLIAHHLGIHEFDGRSFTPVKIQGEPFTEYVVDAFKDSRNRLWLGTMGRGVFYHENGTWHTISISDGLASNTARFFAEDSTGAIWIGTRHGLNRWDGKVTHTFDHKNGLRGDYILTLHIDSEDTVWIGMARAGLQRIINNEIKPMPGEVEDSEFSSRTVFSIMSDHKGTLWAGMTSGVARINRGEPPVYINLFEHFSVDSVFHVIDDHRDSLWVSSSNGLHRIPYSILAEDLESNYRIDSVIRTFTKRDGLPSDAMRPVSRPLLDSDKRIWMPTDNGFVIIDPKNIPTSIPANPPFLDRIEVNDSPSPNTSDWHIDSYKGILASDVRRLHIDFTTPSFHTLDYTKFRYRLNGFEEDWRISTNRFAEYTNIPAGDYQFEVQAANPDGQWNPIGATATLSISPQFTETLWFMFSFITGAFGLSYLLHLWRNRILRARQHKLETIVEQRTAEIRQSETKLKESNEKLQKLSDDMSAFLGIAAHDLRNPIGAIAFSAECMQPDLETMGDTDLLEYNQIIRTGTRQMDELLNNLLDINRIEAGQTPAKIINFDPIQSLEQMIKQQREFANRKGIKLTFRKPSNVTLRADQYLLNQVVENLISNAIKFSNPNTEIKCEVKSIDDMAEISVTDEGPGIPPDEQSKVFSKFSKLSPRPTGNETSTGLGLSIVKQLSELMGGEAGFNSVVDKGSRFWVRFPVQ